MSWIPHFGWADAFGARVAFGIGVGVLAVMAAALALGVGIAVYVAGSFALARTHNERRGFGLFAREVLREVLYAAFSQPFLPLFYVIGRRLDRFFVRPPGQPASVVPIVFVHGYMQNRVGFVGLARALSRRGMRPLFAINYPWFDSLPANAERLQRFCDRVRAETGSAKVDLVCHSMGGLVAMEMMRAQASRTTPGAEGEGIPELSVRRCVTIATPHAGVAWRGPIFGVGGASLRRGSKFLETQATSMLRVPCLSIYSTHDNIVHPKATSSLVARGGRDVEIPGVAHLAILFAPSVADHVADFLTEPDPARAAGEKQPALPGGVSV